MGGGTVALENREWNLQCVDARLLPHPQLSSFRCRHRRPAGDEVVRLLPDASLLEPRDRTLPECTLPIRAMVSAGRHRGLGDRKSTRLNSSHLGISYAVFCLKKKNVIT